MNVQSTKPLDEEVGLEPLGRAILVEPYEPERKSSVIALPDFVLDKERTLDTMVRVVAIGPVAWPDEPARAKVGDIVYIAKFTGFMAKGLNGKPYRFVNDRDVFARVVLPTEASHG